ncbi:MAG: hypothetical protein V4850_32985 [Myxococcota bacterium]
MSALGRLAPGRVVLAARLQAQALAARGGRAWLLVLLCAGLAAALILQPGPRGSFSLMNSVQLGYMTAVLAQMLVLPVPWRGATVLPGLPVTRGERGLGSLLMLVVVVVGPAVAFRLGVRGLDGVETLVAALLSVGLVVVAGAAVGSHVAGRRPEEQGRWVSFLGLTVVAIVAGRYGLPGAAISTAGLVAALIWDERRGRSAPAELPDRGPLGAPSRPADQALWPFARAGWASSLAAGAGAGLLAVVSPGLFRLVDQDEPLAGIASAIRLGINELLPPGPGFELALPGLVAVVFAMQSILPRVAGKPRESGVYVLLRLPIAPRSLYVQELRIAGLRALLVLVAANLVVALALVLNGSVSGPADLAVLVLPAPVWLAVALLAHAGTALVPIVGGWWIRAAPWALFLVWSQFALLGGLGPFAAVAGLVHAVGALFVGLAIGTLAWSVSRAGRPATA